MKDVQEILKTEKKANELIESAQKETQKIVSKAKQAAFERISQGKKDIDTRTERELKTREQQLAGQTVKILEEAKNQAERLSASATKQVPKAEKILLGRVHSLGE